MFWNAGPVTGVAPGSPRGDVSLCPLEHKMIQSSMMMMNLGMPPFAQNFSVSMEAFVSLTCFPNPVLSASKSLIYPTRTLNHVPVATRYEFPYLFVCSSTCLSCKRILSPFKCNRRTYFSPHRYVNFATITSKPTVKRVGVQTAGGYTMKALFSIESRTRMSKHCGPPYLAL